uniref:Uncharacterized protein n=1 Tax=Arundo donax TaxID=35708 RepID=A0A0A9CCE1_ARUDO
MDTTAPWRGSISQATICLRLRMAVEAATIGLMALWGIAACPPFPLTVAKNRAAVAAKGPGLDETAPTGRNGSTCKPNMADTESRASSKT